LDYTGVAWRGRRRRRARMDEWFAELLAKGRTGQLTPGETEELARLLNAWPQGALVAY
jgi:hypothetical protein